MRSINELFRILCLLFFLSRSSCNSEAQSTTATITLPQTLSNYTYLLQEEWSLNWEDCDPEVNPIQSPIAIDTHQLGDDCPDDEYIELTFQDASMPYKLEGASLSIDYGYSMLYRTAAANGRTATYQSGSIHFHSRGQHMVDHLQYQLEVHVNYKLIEGNAEETLILALPVVLKPQTIGNLQKTTSRVQSAPILTNTVASSSTSDSVINNTDAVGDQALKLLSLFDRESSHQVNPHELFAALRKAGFYMYVGSMSAPPCMPGVVWLVADTPASISASDLTIWRMLINEGKPNNREVQHSSTPKVKYFPNKCMQKPVLVNLPNWIFRMGWAALLLVLLLL